MDLSIWTFPLEPISLDPSIWTISFGAVHLDSSIWTCLIKHIYMDWSIWTHIFGRIYFDPPCWFHLFGPVYLDYSVKIIQFEKFMRKSLDNHETVYYSTPVAYFADDMSFLVFSVKGQSVSHVLNGWQQDQFISSNHEQVMIKS